MFQKISEVSYFYVAKYLRLLLGMSGTKFKTFAGDRKLPL